MSSDPVNNLLTSRFGLGTTREACDLFTISGVTSRYHNGEFHVSAQLDGTPDGPATVQGCTIYAIPVVPDQDPKGIQMYAQGSVGPRMDQPAMGNFALPFSMGCGTMLAQIKPGTTVLVVLAVAWGASRDDTKMCLLWHPVDM